jgi:uncharacterized protein with ParB-like and HNH nuclease domain
MELNKDINNSDVSDSPFDGDDEGSLDINEKGVAIDKADRSLNQFHKWYKDGRLIIDPEWQRNFVWKTKRSSQLIESFLMDIPVPVVYLAKNDNGNYEVIDGLQRLTSVFNFFDNQYPLNGLDVLTEFNGKKYIDLPKEQQYKLEDVTLRSFELSPKTSKDLLFTIFERLNTGGVALNRMEIRNSIYRGSLNNMIRELSSDKNFINCINQSGLKDRMRDREIILRFLAFYEKTYHKCTKGLGRFFNDFYQTYQNADEQKLRDFSIAFKNMSRAAFTIFGDNAFRLRAKKGGWNSRINAAVFQSISVPLLNYNLSQLTRNADSIYEEYLDLITNDHKWIECVTSNTANPQNVNYTFSTWENRLKHVIGGSEKNDNQRCFSKALKLEIFKQHDKCEICGQQIKLVDDAALDHEVHYWRGGKTIPENARLVHRLCNQKRNL